jgi:hypothetical protein
MANKDTIHDTIIVYVEKNVHTIDDSTLVEEVLHRYDKISSDIQGHDSTPAVVSLLALIAIIISIINRRRKNKNQ